MMISKNHKIYVAGHRGMVGSACWRALENSGYKNIVGLSSKDLDLRERGKVNEFISSEKPAAIIDAAARVGGIHANNSSPYEFLLDNMRIQNNLIQAAHENDITKFIFLGSSCIYPRLAEQPLKEEYLLSGSLEPTNEGYAIAKIAGVKLIEFLRRQYGRNYVSLMPTNLYGPGDNFDLENSHVLPAMIRKFHEAKERNHDEVKLWGSGTPLREFLHVDDLARAVILALENNLNESLYNVGVGRDLSIKRLAELIQTIIGHKGQIVWDANKPDGTPRKLLDISKISLEGWEPKINIDTGITSTYKWFLENGS